ncbi:uncharacterized protein LOC127386609 [Apus apus]|uniref:uncharacterized protein LOC127386609 n=1 Tax=Apus apus TaxID=8895 RepID=UPI0021F90034|nr:uncharacterized protein LOC127386609 [Apus apus]
MTQASARCHKQGWPQHLILEPADHYEEPGDGRNIPARMACRGGRLRSPGHLKAKWRVWEEGTRLGIGGEVFKVGVGERTGRAQSPWGRQREQVTLQHNVSVYRAGQLQPVSGVYFVSSVFCVSDCMFLGSWCLHSSVTSRHLGSPPKSPECITSLAQSLLSPSHLTITASCLDLFSVCHLLAVPERSSLAVASQVLPAALLLSLQFPQSHFLGFHPCVLTGLGLRAWLLTHPLFWLRWQLSLVCGCNLLSLAGLL